MGLNQLAKFFILFICFSFFSCEKETTTSSNQCYSHISNLQVEWGELNTQYHSTFSNGAGGYGSPFTAIVDIAGCNDQEYLTGNIYFQGFDEFDSSVGGTSIAYDVDLPVIIGDKLIFYGIYYFGGSSQSIEVTVEVSNNIGNSLSLKIDRPTGAN